MEKLIFYIILGVGYLIYTIYKSVKKADEERAERQRRLQEQDRLEAEARKQAGKITKQVHRSPQQAPKPVSQAPLPPKPTSLEDLLREFGMEPPKEVTTAPAPIFETKKYNPPPVDNSPKKPFVLDYDDNIEDEVTVAKKRQAEIEAEIARVKKEGVNEIGDFHLDPYKLKERKANEYREWMKDKGNIKKAFVASEIFKTKF